MVKSVKSEMDVDVKAMVECGMWWMDLNKFEGQCWRESMEWLYWREQDSKRMGLMDALDIIEMVREERGHASI